jgi:hypothetical protein
MTTTTKELLIISGNTYSYRQGDNYRTISKRECDRIFKRWKDSGETIHRKYGMGGRTCWVWIE